MTADTAPILRVDNITKCYGETCILKGASLTLRTGEIKVLMQARLISLERVSRENFYSLSLDTALADLRRLVEQAEVSCT